ncbi:MAG: GNAT family N-acetyltransferase [Lachnospiraceae bacterium]
MNIELIETMNYQDLVPLMIQEGLEITENTPVPEGIICCIELLEKESGLRIGCGVVTSDSKEIVLRCAAIKKEFQKQGFGTVIVNRALEIAKENGAIRLVLTAKVPEFYKKLGFQIIPYEKYPYRNDCATCKRFHNGCNSEMMEYVFG